MKSYFEYTTGTTSRLTFENTNVAGVSASSLSSSFEFTTGSLSRLTFGNTIGAIISSTKSGIFSGISIGSTLGSTSFINSK